MGIKKRYYNNTGKPVGLLGKKMVNTMNTGHAAVSDWGLSYLEKLSPSTIAEFGCGGGRNVSRLLEIFPKASVTALDYSSVSVKKTAQVNKKAIREGRCSVVEGDVSDMPLENELFDLATAFETVYFWPGPVKSFREVHRVLRSGGNFMIVNDTDGTKEIDHQWADMIDGMHLYNEKQLATYLKEAGFSQTIIHKDELRRWICVIGIK